jgi:hypothetical protein
MKKKKRSPLVCTLLVFFSSLIQFGYDRLPPPPHHPSRQHVPLRCRSVTLVCARLLLMMSFLGPLVVPLPILDDVRRRWLDDDRVPAEPLLWRTTRMATFCTGTEIYSRTDVRLLVLNTLANTPKQIVSNKY